MGATKETVTTIQGIELYSYQANSIRYFSFFHKKMTISYSCLIVAVAVVIGLRTATAAPADDVKAVAADAAKLASLAREAADVRCTNPTFCKFCRDCNYGMVWVHKCWECEECKDQDNCWHWQE